LLFAVGHSLFAIVFTLYAGTLKRWNFGTLKPISNALAMQEYAYAGTLELWNIGTLEPH